MGFLERRLDMQEAELGFEETARRCSCTNQLFSIIYIMRLLGVTRLPSSVVLYLPQPISLD